MNESTNTLLKKTFCDRWVFVFDSFPRRVFLDSSGDGKSARKLWPEYKTIDDELYMSWRRFGGQVTFLLGQNAACAYNKVIKSEGQIRKTP